MEDKRRMWLKTRERGGTMSTIGTRPTEVQIRRAHERFHTEAGWLDSWHSFSFSNHYDPANTHHGLLLVNNDDRVKAGTGFRTHPHQDMEIVTWVLDGELEHKDSEGNNGIIYPGLAQRMSAGTGIWHSEMNSKADKDVHFIQMWVVPDTQRIAPGYEQLDINGYLRERRARPELPQGRDTMVPSRFDRKEPSSGAADFCREKPLRCLTANTFTCTWQKGPDTWKRLGACTQAMPFDSPQRERGN